MSTKASFDISLSKEEIKKVHRQKLSKGKGYYYVTLSDNLCKRLGISESDFVSQQLVQGGIMLRVVRKKSQFTGVQS